MIYVNNLSASYKNKTILHNISFQINSGDFVCLCGKNGVGKTTLLSVLANLNNSALKIENPPEITINNQNVKISSLKPKECAKRISFMSQKEFSLWDLSVFDIVLSGRFPYTKSGFYSKNDYKIAEEIISEMNLQELKNRNVHSLSDGEFQKVRIARSLCQQSDFILLDEPFSNLDFVYEPKIIDQLKKIAKEKNIGILLSIHNLNLAARFADKILLLNEKGCDFAAVEQIFTSEKLSAAFGQPLNVQLQSVYDCPQIL